MLHLNGWKKTFKSAIEGKEEVFPFCNNLEAQTHHEFREKLESMNGRRHFGPKNLTDSWQMVDAGYGKMLKVLSKNEQQLWLEKDENIDKWLGITDEKLTAKECRILITQWVGEAHIKLQDGKYDRFRRFCFERTGGLITVDGSGDDLIKPEGMLDYCVTPPLPVVAADDPFAEVVPVEAEIPADDNLGGDEYDVIDIDKTAEEDHEAWTMTYLLMTKSSGISNTIWSGAK